MGCLRSRLPHAHTRMCEWLGERSDAIATCASANRSEKGAVADKSYEEEERVLAEQEEFLPHIASKKMNQFTDFEGKTSFGMSIFNLSNAIMGSGILGLAYAMRNTGIILFVVLLISIALLSSYSIHLLLKCAGVVGIRAYEQLGFRAFGHGGKVVAAVIISIHNIGAMSSYLFIVKSELPLVIQTFLGLTRNNGEWYMNGNVLIVIATVCVILPLAMMKHLGYLGYTSGLSLTCMCFFLISVIYKKFQIACPHALNDTLGNSSTVGSEEDTCTTELFTVNSQDWRSSFIPPFGTLADGTAHPPIVPCLSAFAEAWVLHGFLERNRREPLAVTFFQVNLLFGWVAPRPCVQLVSGTLKQDGEPS
ncbi:hypothetical protein JRQ81_003689 [Phrynocephalus forsythii]|uniref:Amino acid transporter transmembrane domain-containing protein n=1 Tax=Phrynocephalus forsythii TaxID=171643 RepID=A0A9Q0XKP7_9SAUR|nr:hypothetical protein JRQ81_003689 [Phrynocephalus forsythii]